MLRRAGCLIFLVAPMCVADQDDYFTLKFEAERPFRLFVGTGNRREDVFWVLPYWLENETSRDRQFWLEITGVSDKDVKYRDSSYGIAYDKVRDRLGLRENDILWSHDHVTLAHDADGNPIKTKVPRVRNEDGSGGDFPIDLNLPTIAAGQRVRCVAVFQFLDREMDQIVISVRGLSNIRTISTPSSNIREVTERVLKLTYRRPGDEFYTSGDVVRFVGREWADESREYRTDLR